MGSKRERWKEKVMRALEIPGEVVLDLPRLVFTGNRQVRVENHRGVIAYSSQEVRVRVENGELVFQGEGLSLGAILPEELMVEGKIHSLTYREN